MIGHMTLAIAMWANIGPAYAGDRVVATVYEHQDYGGAVIIITESMLPWSAPNLQEMTLRDVGCRFPSFSINSRVEHESGFSVPFRFSHTCSGREEWNDNISSFKLAPGICLNGHKNAYSNGPKTDVFGDHTGNVAMVKDGWNDALSSISVGRCH